MYIYQYYQKSITYIIDNRLLILRNKTFDMRAKFFKPYTVFSFFYLVFSHHLSIEGGVLALQWSVHFMFFCSVFCICTFSEISKITKPQAK